MEKTYNLEPIKQVLQTAKTVLILLPQDPSLDAVAAALALYLSLSKNQLSVTIGCSTEMTVNFNRLFGVDKIKPRIGNQNLVISFAYPEDSLEKVSYDKDPQNQKFHLTIEPKPGQSPLDSSQVEFSYTGSNADFIFVIGARSLEDLGELYQQEKAILDDKSKTLVNLSNLDKNSQFGSVNLYDPTASGCSEIAYTVIKALNLPFEPDIATNLLAGIEQSTNNLASASSADTFEIIADLLRSGAQKGHLDQSSTPPLTSRPFPGLRPSPFLRQPLPTSTPSPISASNPASTSNLIPPQTPLSPSPLSPASTPSFPTPAPTSQSSTLPPVKSTPPSPDWLKPKIVTTSSSKI